MKVCIRTHKNLATTPLRLDLNRHFICLLTYLHQVSCCCLGTSAVSWEVSTVQAAGRYGWTTCSVSETRRRLERVRILTGACTTAGTAKMYPYLAPESVILRGRLPAGRIKCCTPSVRLSVRLSVACLQFSRNGKAIETSNLAKTQRWIRVTSEANLRSKSQKSKVRVTGNENVKIVFSSNLPYNGSIYVKPKPK